MKIISFFLLGVMMSNSTKKLIELSKQYEAIKEKRQAILDELEIVYKQVVEEVGLGTMFQDDDGTVFRVVKPSGVYIPYHEYKYERTRRHAGEKPGITLKDARENGYDVK